MTNQKLITICIATYNRSKTVARLVQELLDFELNDQIEILVIDNDSPDNTFEELSKFSHHNNVSIFKNEKNIGFSRSLLRCFNLCKTEYLIYLPDDDILYKDGISELLSFLPTLDLDFLAPRWKKTDGLHMRGRGSDKVKEISSLILKASLFSSNTSLISSSWSFSDTPLIIAKTTIIIIQIIQPSILSFIQCQNLNFPLIL